MQDPDGLAVGRKHLGEALVAVGRFIQTTTAQHDVGPVQPTFHHLRLHQPLTLDDTGLAIFGPGSHLPAHDTSRSVDRGVEAQLRLGSVQALEDYRDLTLVSPRNSGSGNAGGAPSRQIRSAPYRSKSNQ